MNKSKGCTLIEAMIVLAIVGILLSIIVPYFQSAAPQSQDAPKPANVKVM